MSDPIDRQAAIDAVRKAKGKGEAHRMLVQLPPAQPSVSKMEIVGDTISRQAAIKAICEDGTMLERQGKYTMTMAERKQKDADILDTLPPAQLAQDLPKGCTDTISRQAVIDAFAPYAEYESNRTNAEWVRRINMVLSELPSAQPERDIPKKPIETTDRAWGIPSRQAVCPNCDYYLGHVAFLGDYEGKKITYCETCGQAIDWEGWEFDE